MIDAEGISLQPKRQSQPLQRQNPWEHPKLGRQAGGSFNAHAIDPESSSMYQLLGKWAAGQARPALAQVVHNLPSIDVKAIEQDQGSLHWIGR